jgi:hypothetical protein
MGFRHGWKKVLRGGIHATLAAPLDVDSVVVDALADRLDTLRLEEKMIVDKIDRAIIQRLLVLELLDNVLGAA